MTDNLAKFWGKDTKARKVVIVGSFIYLRVVITRFITGITRLGVPGSRTFLGALLLGCKFFPGIFLRVGNAKITELSEGV